MAQIYKTQIEKGLLAAKKIKPDIQIWYHSDGNIEIIPELISWRNYFESVQPECLDPVKIKGKYGNILLLMELLEHNHNAFWYC